MSWMFIESCSERKLVSSPRYSYTWANSLRKLSRNGFPLKLNYSPIVFATSSPISWYLARWNAWTWWDEDKGFGVIDLSQSDFFIGIWNGGKNITFQFCVAIEFRGSAGEAHVFLCDVEQPIVTRAMPPTTSSVEHSKRSIKLGIYRDKEATMSHALSNCVELVLHLLARFFHFSRVKVLLYPRCIRHSFSQTAAVYRTCMTWNIHFSCSVCVCVCARWDLLAISFSPFPFRYLRTITQNAFVCSRLSASTQIVILAWWRFVCLCFYLHCLCIGRCLC